MLFGASPAAAASGGSPPLLMSGTDLAGWTTVVGDGVWAGPGQAPVTTSDLGVAHLGGHSLLEANVNSRGVMAHNITFDRVTDPTGMAKLNSVEAEFRIPFVPQQGGAPYCAQTFEVGQFVWDGAATRRDYGWALQWVLNPWLPDFGVVRAWSMTSAGVDWVPVGYLEPDINWHSLRCTYRPFGVVDVLLDGVDLGVTESVTEKDPTWGSTVDSRLQFEIISLWPGSNPSAPPHRAEVRNWQWHILS